jgi:hypothetical protein
MRSDWSGAAPVSELGEPPVTRRSIPFDYAFRFTLTGTPDRKHTGKVTVSIEAAFTAVSIGYGLIPDVTPITFGPPLAEVPAPAVIELVGAAPGLRHVTLLNLLSALKAGVGEAPAALGEQIGPRTASALLNGIRVNPDLAELAFNGNAAAPLNDDAFRRLFQTVAAPPDRVQFLYALFDDGSGREFQNDPLLSTAGLGGADGGRPFRNFSPPVRFSPQTTIRLEITEKAAFRGELHVSLHGYKVLGGPGTPTGRQLGRALRRRSRR